MKKRATVEQKRCGIMTELHKSKYPLTAHWIARELGFQTGQPLYSALISLEAEGFIVHYKEQFLGKPAKWWYLTPEGRNRVKIYLGEG